MRRKRKDRAEKYGRRKVSAGLGSGSPQSVRATLGALFLVSEKMGKEQVSKKFTFKTSDKGLRQLEKNTALRCEATRGRKNW